MVTLSPWCTKLNTLHCVQSQQQDAHFSGLFNEIPPAHWDIYDLY